MKRFSLIFLLAFILSGCSSLCNEFGAHPQKVAVAPDLVAFEQAFAAFQDTNQVTVLEDFIAIYPDSLWAQRAHTVVLYAREVEQRKEQMKVQENTISEQVVSLRQLRQENNQLAQTIEQLKGSLIEIEKRPL